MWGSHGALLIPDPSLLFSLAVCSTKISFPGKVSVSGFGPKVKFFGNSQLCSLSYC